MKIVIVTWDYPDKIRSVFPFVKNLVVEWARQGHSCTVIAPYSITSNRKLHAFKEVEEVERAQVTVLRPNYLSFSNITMFGVNLSEYFHKKAVRRAFSSLKARPDVIYSHFWKSGLESFPYARKHRLPLFVATGESTIDLHKDQIEGGFKEYLNGVICVSTKNLNESVNLELMYIDQGIVLPNAIDNKIFKKEDKTECRRRIGLPLDAFIVSFVGWFDERKGVRRVEEAIRTIEGEKVNSIFIGSGSMEPNVDGILFKGRLQHSEISLYLNACDAFVLPTLNEGCCNAIIEAMACGLPVISSDLPFNYDVCDESNSILVNPNNIEEIKSAIKRLRDDKELRQKLSEGALNKARSLTIDKRASAIISFMNEKI